MKKISSRDWIRCTSLGMCFVFVYVHTLYGAIEPVKDFWSQRKAAAEKLRQGGTGKAESQTPPRVALPEKENTFLAQLPSVDLHILSNSVPKFPGAVPVSAASLGAFPIPSNGSLPQWMQSIPMSYASFKEIYLPPDYKLSDLMIVHIQDAHDNFEAQKNIARIIESLANEPQAPMVVGVEGARGPFDFTPYRTFPDKEITREIADNFLKDSLITGSEYVGFTTENLPLFWGVETEDLYLKHVQSFKNSVPLEKDAQRVHQQLTRAVHKLKARLFSPQLRELDEKITQHHKGEIDLGVYLKFLTAKRSAVGSQLSAVNQFLTALKLEESLDYKEVEKQRKGLMDELAGKLSNAELKNLVTASLSYRLGDITYGVFYKYLKDFCSAYSIQLSDWPEMNKYIRYVFISEKIKVEELLKEIQALEQRSLASMILSPQEKALAELSQDVLLIEKLFTWGLSPEDWDLYKSREDKIKRVKKRINELSDPTDPTSIDETDLSKLLSSFASFNDAAIARNSALVNNLLEKCNAVPQPPTPSLGDSILEDSRTRFYHYESRATSSQPQAVLVAGGFHTRGMTQLLKEKVIAYVVITPRLGKVEGTGTEYLDIFRRNKTPLEKLFTGERITLAHQTVAPVKPMGHESVLHREVVPQKFVSEAVTKFAAKEAGLVTSMNSNVKKSIIHKIMTWFRQLGKNGFGPIQDLVIQRIEEVRTREGKLRSVLLTLRILRSNGTTISLDGVSEQRGSEGESKDFSEGRIPIMQRESKEGPTKIYISEHSWTQRIGDLIVSLLKNIAAFLKPSNWQAQIATRFRIGLLNSLEIRTDRNFNISLPAISLNGRFHRFGDLGGEEFLPALLTNAGRNIFKKIQLILSPKINLGLTGLNDTFATHRIVKTRTETLVAIPGFNQALPNFNGGLMGKYQVLTQPKFDEDRGELYFKGRHIETGKEEDIVIKAAVWDRSKVKLMTSRAYVSENKIVNEILDWIENKNGFRGEFLLLDKNNPYDIHGIGTNHIIALSEYFKEDTVVFLHEAAEAMGAAGRLRYQYILDNLEDRKWYDAHMAKPGRQGLELHYAIRALLREACYISDFNLTRKIKGREGMTVSQTENRGISNFRSYVSMLKSQEADFDPKLSGNQVRTQLEFNEGFAKLYDMLLVEIKKRFPKSRNVTLLNVIDMAEEILKMTPNPKSRSAAVSANDYFRVRVYKDIPPETQRQIKDFLETYKNFVVALFRGDPRSAATKMLIKAQAVDLKFAEEVHKLVRLTENDVWDYREELVAAVKRMNMYLLARGFYVTADVVRDERRGIFLSAYYRIDEARGYFKGGKEVVAIHVSQLDNLDINEENFDHSSGDGLAVVLRNYIRENILILLPVFAWDIKNAQDLGLSTSLVSSMQKLVERDIVKILKDKPNDIETVFEMADLLGQRARLVNQLNRALISRKSVIYFHSLSLVMNSEFLSQIEQAASKIGEKDLAKKIKKINRIIHQKKDRFSILLNKLVAALSESAEVYALTRERYKGENEKTIAFSNQLVLSKTPGIDLVFLAGHVLNVLDTGLISTEEEKAAIKILFGLASPLGIPSTSDITYRTLEKILEEAANRLNLNDVLFRAHTEIFKFHVTTQDDVAEAIPLSGLPGESGGPGSATFQIAPDTFLFLLGLGLGLGYLALAVFLPRMLPSSWKNQIRQKTRLRNRIRQLMPAGGQKMQTPGSLRIARQNEGPREYGLGSILSNNLSRIGSVVLPRLLGAQEQYIQATGFHESGVSHGNNWGQQLYILALSHPWFNPASLGFLGYLKAYREGRFTWGQFLAIVIPLTGLEIFILTRGVRLILTEWGGSAFFNILNLWTVSQSTVILSVVLAVASILLHWGVIKKSGLSLTEFGKGALFWPALIWLFYAFFPSVAFLPHVVFDFFMILREKSERMENEKVTPIPEDPARGIALENKGGAPMDLIPQTQKRLRKIFVNRLKEIQGIKSRDEFNQLIKVLKLFEMLDVLALDSKGRRSDEIESIDLSQLTSVIGFMSHDEIADVIGAFTKLYDTDPEKAEASFGVFAEKLFKSGGKAESLHVPASAFMMDFKETWAAYRGLRAILAPQERLTEKQVKEKKSAALQAWKDGARRGRELANMTPVLAQADIGRTLVYNVTNLSENNLAVLSKELIRQSALPKEGRNIILLLTQEDTLDVKNLKDQLVKHGVDSTMFKTIFPSEKTELWVITGKHLAEKQKAAPAIEIDTDALYGIALNLAQRILGPQVNSIELDIYTDEMIFKESWRKEFTLRILYIVSQTQVIIATQDIESASRVENLLAISQ